MLGDSALSQQGYRGQLVQQQQQQPKYPPPLIPVRHLNGTIQYDGTQYQAAMDAVDLSAPPRYIILSCIIVPSNN